MCSGGLVSKPQGEPGTKPAHNVHFSYSRVIGLEPMSGALGIGCRNHKRKRKQNQLRLFIVSIPVSLAWSELRSGALGTWWQNHKVNKTSSQSTFSSFPCHWLGAHIRDSGGPVSQPQGELGTKPAHNANFLHSRVISIKLMSGALGAWCRNRNVKPGQNEFSLFLEAHVICSGGLMSNFSIPVSLAWKLMNAHCVHSRVVGGSSCHVLYIGAWCRNHKVNPGDRTSSQCTLFHSRVIRLELMSCAPGARCRAHNAHFLHSRVIGLKLMSCVLGVVVSKPQGEPGTKPARNAHFLHSRVISLKLMSNAQGAWCRKHQVNRGQNQLTMYIFHCGSLAWSFCQVLWGPGDETKRWTGDKTS